jgi:hypothetical protein
VENYVEELMIKNWARAFASLKRHLSSLSLGGFWGRALQIAVRGAPEGMTVHDQGARSVYVLATVPLNLPQNSADTRSPGLDFPFVEYRRAMDSGFAAKAIWTHLMKVHRPDDFECEVVVLHGRGLTTPRRG